MAYIKKYWNNKEERAKKAQAHTRVMNDTYKDEIQQCIEDTVVYDVNFSCNKKDDNNTKIIIEPLDSVSAIMKYSKRDNRTAVLNFSSYKNPGGGFLCGSKAQEECLCHESFLYNVLKEFQYTFYDWNNQHKNKALYLNRGLYSPRITFFRDTDILECDVITCASPNKSAAQQYQNVSNEENLEVLKSRIKFVLDIAADNCVETLILGAYGCGVFGQDPTEVASIFKEYLETTHKCFEKVVFAIPNGRDGNLEAFKKVFKKTN